MTLAAMLSLDRDALICDMAETYHLLDLRSLPVRLLATLAAGLRDDSRIRMKMLGLSYVSANLAIIQVRDILMQIFSKEEKPFLLTDVVLGDRKDVRNTGRFATPEDFEAAREKLIRGVNDG